MTTVRSAALLIGVLGSLWPQAAWADQAADRPDPDTRPFTPVFLGLRFDAAAVAPGWMLPTGMSISPDPGSDGQTSPPAQVAFEYSHGYEVRNKIHHLASFATLPLFGVAVYTGQKLFNDPAAATAGLRHLHGTIAIAITGLFAVNSITGVWNMVEGRKDPHAGMLRTIHGVLMLVGEAGFMATALDRPNGHTASGLAIYTDKKNQHLALAYSSLSVATVGYLLMLFR